MCHIKVSGLNLFDIVNEISEISEIINNRCANQGFVGIIVPDCSCASGGAK